MELNLNTIKANKLSILYPLTMKKILPALCLLFITASMSAQTTAPGHDIRITIKNCKDTTMFLAFYQFDKQYIADTCKKVVKGNVVFKGPKTLDKGMYFLVSQDKVKLFDFFIADNQKLVITTDTAETYIKNLKSPNSKENDDFFSYVRFFTNKNKEFMAVRKQTKGMSAKDSAAFVIEKGKAMNESVMAFEKTFVEQHKGLFVNDWINLKTEKEATDIPKASNGRPDSMFIYVYYKNHYWDGVNFHDDGVMRTPFFADRLKKYFNNIVIQNPDSVNVEIDRMMAKTKEGTMLQKLVLLHFFTTYESSKVMGFDRVFVHVAEKYILNSPAGKELYDEKQRETIRTRVNTLTPLLLGNVAPDLLVIDTTGHRVIARMGFDTVKTSEGATKLYYNNIDKLAQAYTPLHSIKADYLVLVFWDVDCGHCKTDIPILLKEYHALQQEKYDIKVFAVYTQHDYEKWRKYIIDNKLDWVNTYDGVHINNFKEKYDVYSTPVMYVLDKNKKIKAKRIGPEQVKDIVKQMEREYKKDQEKK